MEYKEVIELATKNVKIAKSAELTSVRDYIEDSKFLNYVYSPICNISKEGDPKIFGHLIYTAIVNEVRRRLKYGFECTTLLANIRVLDPLHRYVNDTPANERVPGFNTPDYIGVLIVKETGGTILRVVQDSSVLPNNHSEFMIL